MALEGNIYTNLGIEPIAGKDPDGKVKPIAVDASGNLLTSGSITAVIGAVDTELTTQDYDSGVGVATTAVVGLVVPASGGAVAIPGDAANGLDVDVTRVQGTVTVDSELPAAAALADGAANPTTPTTGAANLVFNGTTWDRARGDTVNGLLVDVSRVTGTVTVDSELPAAASLADSAANPSTPRVGTLPSMYNGTTWDRMRGDITNGLDVDVTRVSGTVTVGDGGGTISVDDGASSLTVDGTITANAGTGTFTTKAVSAATSAVTSVANSTSNVTLLASNANRLGATVYNDDTAAILRVKLGSTASTTSFTVKLQPEDYYEVPFGYTGIIDGIASAATGSARITEVTA